MRAGLGVRAAAVVVGVVLLLVGASVREAAPPPGFEIIATGVSRPIQLALDGRTLVILTPGRRGDAAGEIHRVDLDGELPVDLSRAPHVDIPFLDVRLATLGSLALDPATRDLYLGEENGNRVYRLSVDERLTRYLDGLRRLPGGSGLVFDGAGRLVVLDHADPLLAPTEEERPPAGLEQFRDEDYRGPLVFRLTLDPTVTLPRRIDRMPPHFPRGWGGRAGGALLPRLVGATPVEDALIVLTSSGDLHRIGADGSFQPFARLPPGQYHRTNLATASDGTVWISAGFWSARLYRVAPGGSVTLVAADLGDPQGIVLDARGTLYLAESSLHRIVRLR
jgi:sugar lactone lactonase YvrE